MRHKPAEARSRAGVLERPWLAVVDDDYDHCFILREFLSSEYEVVCLSSGEELLGALEIHRPEAVILDYDLPGMDGPELCRLLHGDARWKGLTIVFLTALRDEEARRRALDAGAAAFLTKPIKPDEIKSELRRLRAAAAGTT